MSERAEEPFFFISHNSKDKASPAFADVIGRLHAAGIPLGIDYPQDIPDNAAIKPDKFVWRMEGRNEDWEHQVTVALGQGACGIIVLASSNTGADSFVWPEVRIAQTLRILLRPDYGFHFLALEPDAHTFAPRPYDRAPFIETGPELDHEIGLMRAHLQRETLRRANRNPEQRFIKAAMKTMVEEMGSIRLVAGPEIALDAIFTPLRGDTLSAAERSAAYDAFMSSPQDLTDLPGPGSHDRQTRLNAARLAHLRQNPIMPGMPQGLLAAQNPWAVAGDTTTLSDIVKTNGRTVILGEPAAGKTTLLRWLALRFAQVWAALDGGEPGDAPVRALRHHVDPSARVTDDEAENSQPSHVSLGSARLPVFLNAQELSGYVRKHGVGDLVGFLAMRLARMVDPVLFEAPEKTARQILQALLEDGRVLVLLDGLDEIDANLREETLRLIETFAENWTGSVPTDEPSRNNRMVVTSRVVGYHALPLSANWPHVVVDRMTPAVALEFWERLYRSDAFASNIDPKARAEALHHSVYARGRTGLADLAGIPLLATLLAIVFERDRQLPRRRAQIYERVFITITEKRPTDLPSDYVARWLGPLACKLHEGGGPSLIQTDQLRRDLTDRLKEIEPEIRDNLVRARKVAEFLEENRSHLGLLVERSEGLWAFVHRTFQEYLAGLWLAESGASGKDLAALLADARWREPLLLLLGSSTFAGDDNTGARDAVFRDLLAAGDGAAERARIGRFLADALQEMPDLPSLEVLCEVVRAALADVADQDWEALPAFVRIRAMAALYAFGRGDVEQLEAALCALLRDGPGRFSRLVARVILDRHWCSAPLEEALREAGRHDRTDENLPILQALQQVVSESYHGELGAGGKAMATERQLDRTKILARPTRLSTRPTPNETIYDVLRARAQRGRYASIGRLELPDDEVDGFLKRGGASRSPDTTLTPSTKPRIDPRTRQGLRSTVALALGRSFEYRGRIAALTAYGELLRFIGMSEPARQVSLEYNPDLRMRFGIEDPVHHIAVNLDLFLEPTFKDFAPPYAADGEIVFPAALSPFAASQSSVEGAGANLLELALHGLTPDPLKPPEYRAQDVLVAALRDTTGTTPVGRWLTSLTGDQRTALDGLLRRTLLAARDSILHAGLYLAANLHQATPESELAFLQALDTTAKVFPMIPLRASDGGQRTSPRLLAEHLAYRLVVLEAADSQYAAAVALDGQEALPTSTLLAALQALPETVTAAWAASALLVDVGAPFPIDQETQEITLAALDAASRINAGDDMSLRFAQAGMLFKRLIAAPGLQYAASLTPFAGLPRGALSWAISIEEAAEALREIGDPYHDARFALGLHEANMSAEGAQDAERLLDRIGNPVLRLDIAERLATLLPEADAARVRQAATQAAWAITAPTERWRALTRLASQPGYARGRLLEEAALAIDAIADPDTRWLDATSAFRLFRNDKAGPSSPPRTMRAACLRSGRLAPSLLKLPADSGDATAILYIAQTCLDLLAGMAQTVPEKRADRSPTSEDPPWDPGLQVVDLTVELADRLAAMARHEDPTSTAELPSVRWARQTRVVCGFSLFACERWLDRPDHPLAWIAALAIVKGRSRRDRRVLEPLLQAARSGREAFAANAVWMLSRGRLLVQRQSPDTAFQDMGFETLLWIGRLAVDPQHRDLRRLLGCLVMDVEVPDASLITTLLDHRERAPEDRDAVDFIFEYLTWTSEAATSAILDNMIGQDPELQARMLISLAAIDLTQRVEKRKDAAGVAISPPEIESRPVPEARIAEAVRSLGPTNDTTPFRIFQQGGKDLCACIERVCGTPARAQRLAAFYAELEIARIDIRQPLSAPETAYQALDSFLGARTQAANQALPFRHDRLACHDLARRMGADAVRLTVEVFVDLTRTRRSDLELAGLIATACIEFALDTPSLVTAAFKDCLGSEAAMMAFLADLIRDPPGGVSAATATALACLLRPLNQGCAEALVAVTEKPDLGDWILLEQSLLGVGRLDRTALPVAEAALAHERPRANLLAIRLLGALARDAAAPSDVRRSAHEALERFMRDDRSAREIHIFVPAVQKTGDGYVLNCSSLASIARTELFLSDGARL